MATNTLAHSASNVYKTVNPATGEIVREFAKLDDEEAQALLARAHAAHLNWRETPVAERARLFLRFADVVKSNAGELARLTTLEMGKPLAQSTAEVSLVRAIFRYYAERGEELLADEEIQVRGSIRAIQRTPIAGNRTGQPLAAAIPVRIWRHRS
jgi:succinate-semialdehyde dehydrogenase/glutarate-semialdehyde dehydrogenase